MELAEVWSVLGHLLCMKNTTMPAWQHDVRGLDLTLGHRGTDFMYTGDSGGWWNELLIFGTCGSK